MFPLLSKQQVEWLRQRSEDWDCDLSFKDVEAFNNTFQRQLTGRDLYNLLFDLAVDITAEMDFWLRCFIRNDVIYPVDSDLTEIFNHYYNTEYTTPQLREKIRECHGMRTVCKHFHLDSRGVDMDAKFKAKQGF